MTDFFLPGRKSSYFPSFKHFLENPIKKNGPEKPLCTPYHMKMALFSQNRGSRATKPLEKQGFSVSFWSQKPICLSYYPITGILESRILISSFFWLTEPRRSGDKLEHTDGGEVGGVLSHPCTGSAGGCSGVRCRDATDHTRLVASPRRARLTTPMSVVALHVVNRDMQCRDGTWRGQTRSFAPDSTYLLSDFGARASTPPIFRRRFFPCCSMQDNTNASKLQEGEWDNTSHPLLPS